MSYLKLSYQPSFKNKYLNRLGLFDAPRTGLKELNSLQILVNVIQYIPQQHRTDQIGNLTMLEETYPGRTILMGTIPPSANMTVLKVLDLRENTFKVSPMG